MLNWVLFPPSACSVISLTLCQCPCPCLLCLIVFITKESLLILWNNYTTSFSQLWLVPVWFRRKKKCEREGRGEELTEEESESDEEECQHLLSRSLTSLYTSPTPLGQFSTPINLPLTSNIAGFKPSQLFLSKSAPSTPVNPRGWYFLIIMKRI